MLRRIEDALVEGRPMQLFLLRHGIAEEGAGKADADRVLTKEGHKRTVAAAKGLAKIYEPPDRLLVSPKTRAAQTAEHAAQAFKLKAETWDDLGRAGAESLQEALEACVDTSLMLIGHEPTFSELIEVLCYGCHHGQTDLKKAGCAVLELEGKRAELQALLPPKVLVALA
jgi:phosphohistidine phosphatase